MTFNAPEEAFGDREQFLFAGKSVDDSFQGLMILGFVPLPNLQICDRANLGTINTNLNAISTDATIGNNSFIKDNIFTSAENKLSRSTQVGITEVNLIETKFTKSCVSENSSGEISLNETNLPKNSIAKVHPFHVAFPKTTFVHLNMAEISKAQVNLSKGSPIELLLTEVSFPVDSASDTLISQTAKTLPSKIFFSPSIKSEQFLSIHVQNRATSHFCGSIK